MSYYPMIQYMDLSESSQSQSIPSTNHFLESFELEKTMNQHSVRYTRTTEI